MKATADELLLKEFKSGKDAAIRELYQTYSRNLIVFSFKITGDRLGSEDIVSEGFIKLWDRRSTLDGYGDIKKFLIFEVKNRSIDFWRSAKRRQSRHNELSDISEETIYNEYLRTEVLDYLNDLLQLLTPSQRVIIMETLIKGATAEEVAKQLQISLSLLYKEKGKALEVMQSIAREKKMDYPSMLLYLLIMTELAKRSMN